MMKQHRFWFCVRVLGSVVVALLAVAAPLVAQQPALDGFIPMDQLAQREVLPATPLVFYAYSFVWLALIAYVFTIWRRLARVEQDLVAVQQRLTQGSGER